MNKFADPEDADYMQVKEVIENMVTQAPTLVQQLSQKVLQIMQVVGHIPLLAAKSQIMKSHQVSQELIWH